MVRINSWKQLSKINPIRYLCGNNPKYTSQFYYNYQITYFDVITIIEKAVLRSKQIELKCETDTGKIYVHPN